MNVRTKAWRLKVYRQAADALNQVAKDFALEADALERRNGAGCEIKGLRDAGKMWGKNAKFFQGIAESLDES